MPLISCEIEYDLSWKKDSVLIEHYNNVKGATFQINNVKFPVITLSLNDNIKFLEKVKQGFKIRIS